MSCVAESLQHSLKINILMKVNTCLMIPTTSFRKLKKSVFQQGFPGGTSDKEPACQCKRLKRHGFDSWVGKISWRRAWQPTPVFLLGESHGQRSLAGYSPWGHKESDTSSSTPVEKVKSYAVKHYHCQLPLDAMTRLLHKFGL